MTFLMISWRNIWRNKRRSIISISAISFSLALTIYTIALCDGTHDAMLSQAIRFFSGHIQIHRNGYQDDPAIEKSFKMKESFLCVLKADPSISSFSPRLQAQALAATPTNSVGAFVVGILPTEEVRVANISNKVVTGEYLEKIDRQRCIIGEKMAENLGIRVGSDIVFMAQGYDGSLGAIRFKIKGIFRTGTDEMDQAFAFITIEDARELLHAYDMVNSVAIATDSPAKIQDMIQRLNSNLAPGDFEVLSWKELMPELVQIVTLDSIVGYVFLGLVVIVVLFGVLSALFTSVLERNHEFGIMLALGTKPRQIVQLVLLESLLLTGTGVIFGLLIGLGLSLHGVRHPINLPHSMEQISSFWGMENRLYFAIYPLRMTIAVISIIVLSLLFSYYPAWRASKLQPDQALRR